MLDICTIYLISVTLWYNVFPYAGKYLLITATLSSQQYTTPFERFCAPNKAPSAINPKYSARGEKTIICISVESIAPNGDTTH